MALAFPGAGIMHGCELPDASAGTQMQSSQRAIYALNLSVMSPCSLKHKNLVCFDSIIQMALTSAWPTCFSTSRGIIVLWGRGKGREAKTKDCPIVGWHMDSGVELMPPI